MNPSIRIASVQAAADRAHVLARQQGTNARDGAARAPPACSARITPRLPERPSGFTTQGYMTRGSPASSSPRAGFEKPWHRETGAANAARAQILVRRSQPRPVGGLPGSRAPAATRAASTTGRSPTAITPSIGLARAASTIARQATRPPHGNAPPPPRRARDRRDDGIDRWRTSARSRPRGRVAERAQLIPGRGGEDRTRALQSLIANHSSLMRSLIASIH